MKYQQIDVNIKSEFIKLDSLLKYAGVVETGGIGKEIILEERIKVNGQMLKILDSLGIKPTGNYLGGDDDEL